MIGSIEFLTILLSPTPNIGSNSNGFFVVSLQLMLSLTFLTGDNVLVRENPL